VTTHYCALLLKRADCTTATLRTENLKQFYLLSFANINIAIAAFTVTSAFVITATTNL
jgi:hypothetical protein